jgi:hypothetical protein
MYTKEYRRVSFPFFFFLHLPGRNQQGRGNYSAKRRSIFIQYWAKMYIKSPSLPQIFSRGIF